MDCRTKHKEVVSLANETGSKNGTANAAIVFILLTETVDLEKRVARAENKPKRRSEAGARKKKRRIQFLLKLPNQE